tara:strand:+ start:45 stop:1298 length:1254 start_codon:yes stop_codon:yes gene_type:complete
MINKMLTSIGKKSKSALANQVDTKKKNQVLIDYCKLIRNNQKLILSANKRDVNRSINKGVKKNLIDRLILNENKIDDIISSIKSVVKLKDPTNRVLEKWKRPNGLSISKVSIPIGTIAIIYESRPNVTSDVASLCFKSGNPVILRGGSEAFFSNKILSKLFRDSLKKNKINENYVQFIDSTNRNIVDFLLSKMNKYIDVVIPRGGRNLVKKVQKLSNLPVIGHLEGICHTYVDKNANMNMAKNIIFNAKLRNTAICGATETILIHQKILKKSCNIILKHLENHGCKIIGDNRIKQSYKGKTIRATNEDWSKEYLSAKVSVKCVRNTNDAIKHINKYGTMHTDSIITMDKKSAKKFLNEVKSSIAMHNTSTQFADGGEFGFGGEVGISTNKLPPRGPVGLNQLVSYKYQITSDGEIRK